MVMLSNLKSMTKESKPKQKRDQVSLAKKLILAEIEKEFGGAKYAFFSRFERLSVADLSELRRNLDKVSKRTLVAKHSLVKKILEKMQISEAEKLLQGSILVTLGTDEPQIVSKALVDFAKGRESIELRGLILDKKVYEGSFVKELAKLPSKKELLTQVAVRFKSPIAAFAITLNQLIQSLAIALSEVHKKRAQAAPAAAHAPEAPAPPAPEAPAAPAAPEAPPQPA